MEGWLLQSKKEPLINVSNGCAKKILGTIFATYNLQKRLKCNRVREKHAWDCGNVDLDYEQTFFYITK